MLNLSNELTASRRQIKRWANERIKPRNNSRKLIDLKRVCPNKTYQEHSRRPPHKVRHPAMRPKHDPDQLRHTDQQLRQPGSRPAERKRRQSSSFWKGSVKSFQSFIRIRIFLKHFLITIKQFQILE